jgi:PKD repeat protein
MVISGIPATITTSAVPALPGYPNQPKDLWPSIVHDGLLDDFDGNGVVNTNDVVVFFNAYAHGHLSGLDPAPFDYNRNGVIDPDDIVKYYNLIW